MRCVLVSRFPALLTNAGPCGDFCEVMDHSQDRLLDIATADIVARIRAGDKQMFGMVFERYWVPLVHWAYHYLGHQSDAEEVVANVLARLWVKRHDWEIRDSVEAYLFGAVRVECLRWRRDIGRRNQAMDKMASPGQIAEDERHAAIGTEHIIRNEDVARIQDAAGALPPRYREVLALRYEREMEYSEIATVLNVSQGAVRVLVSRAVAALRERLAAL